MELLLTMQSNTSTLGENVDGFWPANRHTFALLKIFDRLILKDDFNSMGVSKAIIIMIPKPHSPTFHQNPCKFSLMGSKIVLED